MWITGILVALLCFSSSRAGKSCNSVLDACNHQKNQNWIQCYEEKIITCSTSRRFPTPGFVQQRVNTSLEAEATPTKDHRVTVPSSALQRSSESSDEVVFVVAVINSTYFKLRPPKSRTIIRPVLPGSVLGGEVLAVKLGGRRPLQNLSQPVKLNFNHHRSGENGTCVFWMQYRDGTDQWSTDGCLTTDNGSHFLCSCNHLSFFAVLVNPKISLDRKTVVTLSYITYVGSTLSVVLTIISLIIYICLHGRRPEKSIGVHMQLTGALLGLHLSFLLCSLWSRLQEQNPEGWVCSALGFFLHWSLIATLSWSVLEGFHLYLLLIRVFNIYVRRYMLKLSLVGWGFPTLVAAVCAISGVYGTFRVNVTDTSSHVSEARICWLSSDFPHMLPVAYSTTVVFPCLVVLYNSCMLGLVVLKLWKLRVGGQGFESGSDWRNKYKERGGRLWKDCATVLGLSCVLGLPWGLALTTYTSTPGFYVFTVLNSLQGVLVFLWSLALTCKSRSENSLSSKDTSSQKIMTTSFNS